MLAGLQVHINALNAIIPDSFIFILDSTDRSFIYQSSDCPLAVGEILALDQQKGIENIFDVTEFYDTDNSDHFYMIKRISAHTFLGFFVLKEKFSQFRISKAKEYFLGSA